MWRAVTLSPRSRIDCGLGPIQISPASMHGLGEVGVLGEEAVAGVDRVGAGLRGGVEDLVEHEVGLGGRLAAERERLVGEPHVRRVGVRLGVHGHAGQPGVLGGPDHPDGDLTAVGDEHLGDLRAGVTGHCAS